MAGAFRAWAVLTHSALTPLALLRFSQILQWDGGICPDPVTCAANCALDGADYSGTYGVRVSGDSASFKLVTVGARGMGVCGLSG